MLVFQREQLDFNLALVVKVSPPCLSVPPLPAGGHVVLVVTCLCGRLRVSYGKAVCMSSPLPVTCFMSTRKANWILWHFCKISVRR